MKGSILAKVFFIIITVILIYLGFFYDHCPGGNFRRRENIGNSEYTMPNKLVLGQSYNSTVDITDLYDKRKSYLADSYSWSAYDLTIAIDKNNKTAIISGNPDCANYYNAFLNNRDSDSGGYYISKDFFVGGIYTVNFKIYTPDVVKLCSNCDGKEVNGVNTLDTKVNDIVCWTIVAKGGNNPSNCNLSITVPGLKVINNGPNSDLRGVPVTVGTYYGTYSGKYDSGYSFNYIVNVAVTA